MKNKKNISGLEMEKFMNQGWPEPGRDWCLTEDCPIDTDLEFLSLTRTFKAKFPNEKYKRVLFDIHVGYQGDDLKNDPTKGKGYRLIELIEDFLHKESQIST